MLSQFIIITSTMIRSNAQRHSDPANCSEGIQPTARASNATRCGHDIESSKTTAQPPVTRPLTFIVPLYCGNCKILFIHNRKWPRLTCQKIRSCRICRSISSSYLRLPPLSRMILGSPRFRTLLNDERPRRADFSHAIHWTLVLCRKINSLFHS